MAALRGETLTQSEARRIALHAQGFAGKRPGHLGPERLLRLADRLGAFQIDSVNVLVRSHYLPAYSRLGPYPLGLLDRLAYKRRALFEYWGHQASLMPVSFFPLFRHSMQKWTRPPDPNRDSRGVRLYKEWARDNRKSIVGVYREVDARGPLSAAELADPGERRGPWWGWSKGKVILEWLFRTGKVTVAARRNWERMYDLTERVLPPEVVGAPAIKAEEARQRLVMIAARALGIATSDDIAFYFFFNKAEARKRVAQLVAEGLLKEVRVEGWRQAAYVPMGTRIPKPFLGQALVSPFDSLVWERGRTRRLFDFDYRIEIYTPAPKRRHGYYVLPFLYGERLVGRLDLKADRKSATLIVPSVHVEANSDPGGILQAMADELRLMAEWLGLGAVAVAGRSRASTNLRKLLK